MRATLGGSESTNPGRNRMIVGALTVDLSIEGAYSLKDKRAVLNKLRDRVRQKFNVAVAEIDGQDLWNYSVVSLVTVSNEQKHANQVLSKALELIESFRDCDVEDVTFEFL